MHFNYFRNKQQSLREEPSFLCDKGSVKLYKEPGPGLSTGGAVFFGEIFGRTFLGEKEGSEDFFEEKRTRVKKSFFIYKIWINLNLMLKTFPGLTQCIYALVIMSDAQTFHPLNCMKPKF